MERRVTFSVGEFYHLYSRGVEKRKIFLTTDDYKRFVRLLFVANSARSFVYRDIEHKNLEEIDRREPLVAIGSWVLMPNHFHILVKELREGGVSQFMEKSLTAYSSYFNKRHARVGPLFQSRFAARHADTDEYLKYLFAYIHLNPIKLVYSDWKEGGIQDIASAESFLMRYRYSSYLDYCGTDREEACLLSRAEFPEYFLEDKDFLIFTRDWLTYRFTE